MKPVFRNLFVVMSGLVLALFMAEVALRVLNRYEPPLVKDYVYVVAILDWRVSNSMDADFRVDALGEAVSRYGAPDIFNTDFSQPQIASDAFTGVLKAAGIQIRMDGKGR